ncbi:MAG: hypothetical protein WAX41_05955 [Lactobacillus delbrueckii]
MADNDQDRGQQGLQDQKQAVAQKKEAAAQGQRELEAPLVGQFPGKRTRPLIKLLVPIKDRA